MACEVAEEFDAETQPATTGIVAVGICGNGINDVGIHALHLPFIQFKQKTVPIVGSKTGENQLKFLVGFESLVVVGAECAQ